MQRSVYLIHRFCWRFPKNWNALALPKILGTFVSCVHKFCKNIHGMFCLHWVHCGFPPQKHFRQRRDELEVCFICRFKTGLIVHSNDILETYVVTYPHFWTCFPSVIWTLPVLETSRKKFGFCNSRYKTQLQFKSHKALTIISAENRISVERKLSKSARLRGHSLVSVVPALYFI